MPTTDNVTSDIFSDVWVNECGYMISIRKMNDKHLVNCLKMCWRKPGWRNTTYLLQELEKRGYKKTNPEYFI